MARGGGKKKVKASAPVPALQVAPEAWAASTSRERRTLDQLKPHPKNVRTHSEDQIAQIMASYAEHGMVKLSIVVDEADTILAGHGTVMGLKRFGAQIPDVEVVVVRGWTDDQKLAFMLRDNRIPENAGWDKEGLGLQLADLSKLPGVNLQALGFKTAELDRLIPKETREGLTDPDAEQPAPGAGPAVSRQGDVWLLGEHRIICGDCTKPDVVAAVLAGDKPQLMVTDPPYGVEYDPAWRNDAEQAGKMSGGRSAPGERAVGQVANDDRADWTEAWLLFPGDVAYVWHGALHSSVVELSLAAAELLPRAQIIWGKDGHVISRGDYHWQHEPCWYAVRKGKPGLWAGDRSQSTLWDIPRPKKSETGHGTQKPIECMKRPIENNSRAGDCVYEPFSGSGTTIIAAEMTGRRCRAIELNPAYVDLAVRRWEQFTGKGAILASGGGEGWAATAAARGIKIAA